MNKAKRIKRKCMRGLGYFLFLPELLLIFVIGFWLWQQWHGHSDAAQQDALKLIVAFAVGIAFLIYLLFRSAPRLNEVSNEAIHRGEPNRSRK